MQQAWEQFLRAAARRPFEWGRWDCVRFAAEALRLRTGADLLAGLDWSDAREALRLLEERGGLRAAVAAVLGEPVAPGFACEGDVVLARDPHAADGRELLAVCAGPHLIVPGIEGLAVLALDAGLCCWKAAHV